MITWQIISGPVDSGKTTFAEAYIISQTNVRGMICRKSEGRRFLQLIGEDVVHLLDTVDNTTESSIVDILRVGRHTFDHGVFYLAKSYLSDLHDQEFDTLMIDEIGKLELNQSGYEPELQDLLSHLAHQPKVYKVILIVRDYLFNDFLKQYKPEKYELLK